MPKAKSNDAHPTLAIATQVKRYVRGKGYFVANDLIPAVSEEIQRVLDEAIQRAESNGRRTIRPSDL